MRICGSLKPLLPLRRPWAGIPILLRLIALPLLSIGALTFPCYTQTARAQEFTVYTEPLAPVHFEREGEVVGIATDIVRELFRRVGHTVRIEIFPWNRAYYLVQQKKNQFIYTINRTPKREKLFQWVGPILPKRTFLYKKRGRADIELNSIEDAKKFNTAVILGHSLTTRLEDLGFKDGVNLTTTPNKTVQTRVFLEDRSDLITGNEYTIYSALTDAGRSMNEVEPALLITTSGYYLGAHIDTDAALIEQLQRASEAVNKTSFIEQTVNAYMHR